ncbi:SRPBCC domain-containing protein [Dyella sp. C9]|uniref:SRPBCC domain-containing protein n=1 Tax=Dyella sp. C9 TaxID=2202154 RepID=UPI0018E562A3|nr:SRPBCC domain-containing protein [Dyella sp. C9]
MTTGVLRSLRISRRFDANAERVFDAWLDPATAGRWLFATDTGEMIRVEIDARVGGRFCFTDRRNGEDIDHVGEYVEIDRPRRIVFTFAVPRYSAAFTRVTIDIASLGAGCELTLTHEDVLPEWADATRQGWAEILGHLGDYIRRRPPHLRLSQDCVRFERLLPGPIERVWAWLAESDKRGQWLAHGDMPTQPGHAFSMRFHHVELARTPVHAPERFQAHADGMTTQHRLLAWEPPYRMDLTWGRPTEPSEVTFELFHEGDEVRLVMTHRRLHEADVAGASAGWHTHLDVLADRLSGRLPQPFWPVFSRHLEHYEQAGS